MAWLVIIGVLMVATVVSAYVFPVDQDAEKKWYN